MTDAEHDDLNERLSQLCKEFHLAEMVVVMRVNEIDLDHSVGVWSRPMEYTNAQRLLSAGLRRIGN